MSGTDFIDKRGLEIYYRKRACVYYGRSIRYSWHVGVIGVAFLRRMFVKQEAWAYIRVDWAWRPNRRIYTYIFSKKQTTD